MREARVLVVAGEASGDAAAARVIEALAQRSGPLDVRGMGGPALRQAGCEVIVDYRRSTAMGAFEVVGRLPALARAFHHVLHLTRSWRPEVALLVDVPDFNMPLGARIRAAGIPVLGYVAPQFWAWRSGRRFELKRSFDRIACVLPFEEPLLRRVGVDACYVGHPAAEQLEPSDGRERRSLGLDESTASIALLPGSRPSETGRMLPVMLEAARRLRITVPRLAVLVAVAPSLRRRPTLPLWCQPIDEQHSATPGRLALAAADAAFVTSGSATLEAGLLGIPQVVAYRLAPSSFVLARLFVRTRFIALPNIILGRRAVPELIQEALTEDALAYWGEQLLVNRDLRHGQLRAASSLRALMSDSVASVQTASMLTEMMQ